MFSPAKRLLDGVPGSGYNGDMARTLGMAGTRGRAKKRERPLGTAVGWGIAATLGAAIAMAAVQFLYPHSVLHDFYSLVHYNASATLPLDPLYQDWATTIQEDDVVETAVALLCGGFALGRLAPSYAPRRRVLVAGALMALGILIVSLGFVWTSAVINQNTLNAHEGGKQVALGAPLSLVFRQALVCFVQTAFCVLGAWLGLRLRDRRLTAAGA